MNSPKQMISDLLVFLSTKSLLSLEALHGVNHRMSADKTKMSLNYDQIEAKDADLIAQVCRGMVLSRKNGLPLVADQPMNDLEVFAFPFCRFFNDGQGAAAQINMMDDSTEFLAKLDGTCIILYFDKHKNQWFPAPRAVCEADLPMSAGFSTMTFHSLVDLTCQEMFNKSLQEVCEALNKDYTYVLELTGPYNKVVCDYAKNCLTLLGVRDNVSCQEIMPTADLTPFPVVESFKFGSLEDMLKFVSDMNPTEREGIVVRDKHFQRVKIKSANYVAYNHIVFNTVKGNMPRNVMRIILNEKQDDVFPILPDLVRKEAEKFLESYREFAKHTHVFYSDLVAKFDKSDKDSRKNLALYVRDNKLNMQFAMMYYLGKNYSQWVKDAIQKDGDWTDAFIDNLVELIQAK